MAPKRSAAAAAPSSSKEDDGETSSGDSTTSHEQEVADKGMSESETEEEEEEEAATAAVKEEEEEEGEGEEEEEEDDEEEEEESTEEGEAEPYLQPSSKRVDPPLTAAFKEEVQGDIDFQPIKRIDHRAPLPPAEVEEPLAKKQPQSINSPACSRKRASGEIGESLSPAPVRPKSEQTAQHSESTEPSSKRIRRVWASGDEVLILAALAQHRRQHGKLPAPGNRGFFESISERLEDNSFHHSDIKEKARSLLRRYKSRVVPTTDHDRRLHSLSKDVWGDLPSIVVTTGSINGNKQADGVFAMSGAENGVGQSQNGGRQSGTKRFKEMCEMYPLLAQEVKLLAEVQPDVESSFTRLDAKRALDVEKKLEQVKYAELKIQTRMVLEIHAPKAKISKKLVSLLAKVSKNV